MELALFALLCEVSFRYTHLYMLTNECPSFIICFKIMETRVWWVYGTDHGIITQVAYVSHEKIKFSVVHRGFEFPWDVHKLDSCG